MSTLLSSAGWGGTAGPTHPPHGEIFTLAMFTDWGFYTNPALASSILAPMRTSAPSVSSRCLGIVRPDALPPYGYDQDKYDTKHTPVPNAPVYYTRADSLKVGTVGTSDWTPCGTTDANGKITVNLTAPNLTAGETYLLATPGRSRAAVMMRSSPAPGGILVKVAASEQKDRHFCRPTRRDHYAEGRRRQHRQSLLTRHMRVTPS